MEEVDAEKDLSIYVDTDLKFRKQAATAVSKAPQAMVVIRDSFRPWIKKTGLETISRLTNDTK